MKQSTLPWCYWIKKHTRKQQVWFWKVFLKRSGLVVQANEEGMWFPARHVFGKNEWCGKVTPVRSFTRWDDIKAFQSVPFYSDHTARTRFGSPDSSLADWTLFNTELHGTIDAVLQKPPDVRLLQLHKQDLNERCVLCVDVIKRLFRTRTRKWPKKRK